MEEKVTTQKEAALEGAFDDEWGGEPIDLSDVVDDESDCVDDAWELDEDEDGGESDEPEGPEEDFDGDFDDEPEEDGGEADEPVQAESEDGIEIKHLGETRTISKEEAKELSQKGMDYDRIRSRHDSLLSRLSEQEATLSSIKELAELQGVSAAELLDDIQAQLIVKREGVSPAFARERVQLLKRERELEQRERRAAAEPMAMEKMRREANVRDFVDSYPGVTPDKIPQQVWAAVNRGEPLTQAYARHEAASLKAQLSAEKKNRENAVRAAGSRSHDGKKKVDPIDKYWYED